MALIRLQNKVPNVYVDESRDFQLFLRLFDVIFNGLKYDIDGISRLTDSLYCKSTMLQLIQTKLGFFTEKDFTDTTLRYILQCFPLLVKKKGSLQAIKEAVYMYLKIAGLETRIEIDIIEDVPTSNQKRLYGADITDHCILIGIESEIKDITPLAEVLKYIIPFGYNMYFYFFTGAETIEYYHGESQVDLFLVSDDINSMDGSKPVASANLYAELKLTSDTNVNNYKTYYNLCDNTIGKIDKKTNYYITSENYTKYIVWDGDSKPDIAQIPEGVKIIYNNVIYIGTLKASKAHHANEVYLVANVSIDDITKERIISYNGYVVEAANWKNVGSMNSVEGLLTLNKKYPIVYIEVKEQDNNLNYNYYTKVLDPIQDNLNSYYDVIDPGKPVDWIESIKVLDSPDTELEEPSKATLHVMYYRPTKTESELAKELEINPSATQVYSKYFTIITYNELDDIYTFDWKFAEHSVTIDEVKFSETDKIYTYGKPIEQRQIAAINTVEAIYDQTRPGRDYQMENILDDIIGINTFKNNTIDFSKFKSGDLIELIDIDKFYYKGNIESINNKKISLNGKEFDITNIIALNLLNSEENK